MKNEMNRKRNGPESRVRTRVSLVLLLIDDFTNKVITGSNVRVWIPDKKPPIRKSEGYCVFVDIEEDQVQVCIEAGMYEGRTLSVRLDGEEPYPLLKVRLTPNRSYPIPRDAICVEGRAEPGSQIRIFCMEDSKPIKLIFDYECGKEMGKGISLYHPEDMEIQGKALYITSGKSQGEFFTVWQKGEKNGEYRLEDPLSRSYKKIGTAIYPVYGSKADEKGNFFLPIPNRNKDMSQFLCEAAGTKATRLERRLKTGVVNFLDFTTEGD